MNTLKLIGRNMLQLLRQVWHLPQIIREAALQRRRQGALDELEAERLDRIRQPSKYLGKP